MSNEPQRLHGLESFLAGNENPVPSVPAVQAEVLGDRSYINVRGNPADPQLMDQFEPTLGQPFPIEANTTSFGAHNIYWLGPDEWLICSEFADGVTLLEKLQTEVDNPHIAVNDLSGGLVTIRLSGDGVLPLLSKGCPLDLHPKEFRPGACAQSGLAKANVLIGYANDGSAFDIIVRRSFADYLGRWMQTSSRTEGIEFR